LARAIAAVRDEEWIRQAVWTVGQLAAAAAEAKPYQTAPLPDAVDSHVHLALRGEFAGHGSNLALDSFAADLLRIYGDLIGPPTISRNADNGEISGTCLDFMRAAMAPLGAQITGNQLSRLIYGKSKAKKGG
jgi:hypothetical protein